MLTLNILTVKEVAIDEIKKEKHKKRRIRNSQDRERERCAIK